MSSQEKFVLRNCIAILVWILTTILVLHYVTLPMDIPGTNGAHGGTFLRVFAYIIFSILLPILWLIWVFDGFDSDDFDATRDKNWYDKNQYAIAFGLKVKGKFIFLLILVLLSTLAVSTIDHSKEIYNGSVIYNKQYVQKTAERLGYYDNMWKTYFAKERIATLSKDVFIQVTTIVMDARKDASQVAWKWIQENQPIPYGEFTRFYADLSAFIESQRQGYYDLEKQCNAIATAHNMLLDTFPNNVYNNIFVHRPHIDYEYGFLSDSTNKVFKTGVEDPH